MAVAWGNFTHFTAYTAKLAWSGPSTTVPVAAWAVALRFGALTCFAAFLSGSVFTRKPLASARSTTDTKVWPIPSFNCFNSRFLV